LKIYHIEEINKNKTAICKQAKKTGLWFLVRTLVQEWVSSQVAHVSIKMTTCGCLRCESREEDITISSGSQDCLVWLTRTKCG